MRRVKVSVPAACTDLGPGYNSLGLALMLYNTVEMNVRADATLKIISRGENAYRADTDHPALQAAKKLFEQAQASILGIDVVLEGKIPPKCGLGDFAVWTVAGLFAANNLLETPMHRDRITELACRLCPRACEAITGILGGLTVTAYNAEKTPIYRRIELTTALKVILIVPEKMNAATTTPAIGSYELIDNVGRAALVVEGLRKGDLRLLVSAIYDPARESRLRALIPGAEAAFAVAQNEGALSGAISGGGPALVFFAQKHHKEIMAAAVAALHTAGNRAHAWVLNVDTQGVVITATR